LAASAIIEALAASEAMRGSAAARIPKPPGGADAAAATAPAPVASALNDASESNELSPLAFPVFAD
jgi:hypothetical protein